MSRAIGVFPRAQSLLRTDASGVVWTERCYLLVIALQLLILLNPAEWPLRHIGLTKHIGLALTLPLLLLHFMGQRVFRGRNRAATLGAVAYWTWPFLVLAVIVTAGSVYASRVHDIPNNFFSMGVYIPFVALAAAVVAQSADVERFMDSFFRLWLAFAAGAIVLIFSTGHVFHEEICLITPLALYFALRRDWGTWRGLPVLLVLAATVWTRKNTAYLIVVLTLIYWLVVVWFPSRMTLSRIQEGFGTVIKACLLALALLAIVLAVTFLIVQRERYLPSGNVEYRAHMYALALRKFHDSPLFGSFFSESSSILFTLYRVETATQVLPVHSDLMDILAHGGLLGAMLWLGGYLRVAGLAFMQLLRPARARHPLTAHAHTLALSALCAVVVLAFNPVLTSVPSVAYMVWTVLGMLIGLAISRSRA